MTQLTPEFPAPRRRPDLSLERRHGGRLCGIDEAGRGPWAGPVIAAAVMLPRRELAADLAAMIDDSKRLSRRQREACWLRLRGQIRYGLGHATVAEIDRLNILNATLVAMARAFARLRADDAPRLALVDGTHAPDLGCRVETVVGGDGRSLSIAAASIVAKVFRDRLMTRLARRHPHYGWHTNAGYGTPEHHAALRRHGATPEHRQSFAPIRELLAPQI